MTPPLAALLAVAWGGLTDIELGRKAVAAAIALLVATVTLPRGRRRLASWPLTLL